MSGKTKGALILAGFLFFMGTPMRKASAQDSAGSALADQLKTQYKVAKLGVDSNGVSVTSAGTVLVIKKGGLLGVPPGNAVIPYSTYKDGELHAPNAFAVASFGGKNTRFLKEGEKVYVTKIDVHSKNDKIVFTVIECDSCNGFDGYYSYKSAVLFQFAKDFLSKADATQISDVIAEVLAPDTTGGQQQAQAQAQPAQAAPQAAASAQPQTVQLGDTTDQVQAALGRPEKVMNLGPKVIYVYKDLKITFVNGKVADVQ